MNSSKPLSLDEIPDAILLAHLALAEAAAFRVQGPEMLEWCDIYELFSLELQRRRMQRRRVERDGLEAMQKQLFEIAAVSTHAEGARV